MSWVAAAVSVGTAVAGGVASYSSAKKAKKANNALLADSKGAFRPLAIPKPQELHVPGAEQILASWRGEVTSQYPAYDAIADKLNVSEQDAARYANQAANPQYYQALNQITGNALQAGRGNIPRDVRANIVRQANEDSYLRGFSYGTPSGGSQQYAGGNDAAANLALRNLGLTSLDLMKYGDQLTGQVLDQSRASRGTVLSAKDVVPTPQIFQDQQNASAIAQYNYETDKAGYDAARKNAPIQAAYNRLALQMGVTQQNNALSAQASTNNAQLAMSALQALGGMYSGGGFSSIGAGKSVSNAPASTLYPNAPDAFLSDTSLLSSALGAPSKNLYQPVSSASTLRAVK